LKSLPSALSLGWLKNSADKKSGVTMKRLATTIASAALSLGLVQAAAAADLPAKARPYAPPPPVANWSGFYIGGSVGGGVASLPVHDNDCFICTLPSEDFKKGGFVGGVYVGYNWQVNPNFLLGVETDFNWASFKADDTTCFGLCDDFDDRFVTSSKLDYFGTIRARAGLVVGNAMAYVTAGAAYARIKSSYQEVDSPAGGGNLESFAEDDSTHWGIAMGAGVEYMPASNWVIRAEYLYLDFVKKNFEIFDTDPVVTATGFRLGKSANAHIARVGLAYKFDYGPVVAKY
jgi:outer membrane immunogenic protein